MSGLRDDLDLQLAIQRYIPDAVPQDVLAAAHRLYAVHQAEALTARTDPTAPALLMAVAVIANRELAGEATITAIQYGAWHTIAPSTPLPGGEKVAWQLRRVSNTLRPSDPAPVTAHHTGWVLNCTGNPVLLESWLIEHGVKAVAHGPSDVRLEVGGEA